MIMSQLDAIAIVGYGGVFPGAEGPEQFWTNIVTGVDATTEVPPGRWVVPRSEVFDPAGPRLDKVYATRGGFVSDLALDLAGIGLDDELLHRLDPVFHLAIVAGNAAWRSAQTASLDPDRVGVIFGNIVLPTERSSSFSREIVGPLIESELESPPSPGELIDPINAFPAGLPAALLARALGLRGTAYTLDAACASSLYALKLASDELRSGRADAMLAGGVSRPDPLYTQMGFSQLQALSKLGRPAPFDVDGDGLIVGEGAGLFVLKRLDDAVSSGDTIHGVIRGIGLSNDIRGDLLAPSSEGQLRAMLAAYEQSGWSPSFVDLIECHATGTPVGDAVEIESLKRLWGQPGAQWSPGQCVIGSVKSNVGHILTAAGAAGLLKLLLALKHRVLPPTANQTRVSPRLELDQSPFRILKSPEPWRPRAGGEPRRAALSGFGFGGINAHVLIEEWLAPAPDAAEPPASRPSVSRSASDWTGCSIAVVGMAAHFGPFTGLRAFQERVLGGDGPVELVSPSRRWGVPRRGGPIRLDVNSDRYAGYFLDAFGLRLDQFRIPPRELAEMLPQQSLMLKVATEAIQDAGWDAAAGLRTGVIVGLGLDQNTNNFQLRWWLAAQAQVWNQMLHLGLSRAELDLWVEQLREGVGPPLTANRTMGSLGGLVASRIAREFRIGGPSFSVSCDETSGTQALQIAAGWLEQGELDAAIVGAVDLCGDIRAVLATAELKGDAPPGEGAAALVLKRLDDAFRDGNRVYAVIRGTTSAAHRSIPPGPEQEASRLTEIGSAEDAIGRVGSATGLAAVLKAAISLYQGTVPSQPERPRGALVKVAGLGGTYHQIILEDVEPMAGISSPCTGEKLGVSHGGPGNDEKGLANRRLTIEVAAKPMRIGRPPRASGIESLAMAEKSLCSSGLSPTLSTQILKTEEATVGAHEAFLKVSRGLAELIGKNLELQLALIEAAASGAPREDEAPAKAPPPSSSLVSWPSAAVALDRAQCLSFAVGSIAAVLGPDYAPIDAHPTRVRLPDEPLMLVDRIVTIEGQPRSLSSGRVVTEHDILEGAWYLDAGRIPPSIAIESGQADLLLSGYLGIDFLTGGLAVYRLLDATVTFLRELPGPGEVIRYDIKITRFFRQGDTHLFRFEFDGTVGDEPLLTMRDGCAGFFSAAELAAGKGIVPQPQGAQARAGVKPADWTDLVPLEPTSLDDGQVESLRRGDLAAAFGPLFDDVLREPLPLPGGRMTLVHRVETLEPQGGRYALGLIRAETDIHPDDWFMVCHFVDDRVMPGTLMYECCLHTLRIFLMRLGWVGPRGEVAFEPVPGVANRLRCRGQVIESTRKVTCDVSVKELGYRPEPYAIADALMYADGKPIVEITDMALKLTGSSRDHLERIWSGRRKDLEPSTAVPARSGDRTSRKVVCGKERILAFATGKPSDGFGDHYRLFDDGRFIARLPGPPYQFLDRIIDVEGEPWSMAEGTWARAEYDISCDAWYFAADRQDRVPYAVLLEAALQSCGWVAAYMGSALHSSEPLKFRNLGGTAQEHTPLDRWSGTLSTWVRVSKVTRSAGMIIQHYDFTVHCGASLVLDGSTYFGFFHPDALAEQVGIRDAALYELTPLEQATARSFPLPDRAPFPERLWRMIDRISALVADGGPHGLGAIEGTVQVDPDAWFFKAHFLGDPVWPGSLGLESFLQLLKVFAVNRWEGAKAAVFDSPGLDLPHRWLYRGQILPTHREVTTQMVITGRDEKRQSLKADGWLSVGGKVIYQVNDFTLRLTS
jgi:acyl transferase domain-containing protein/3-hydroxymyristoyl/3-hydroxydecanoyl-(acyl carrier protein) dehydratase